MPFLLKYLVYKDNDNPFAMGIVLVIILVYLLIAILPMEITSLVFFIIDYELLFNLGKIVYFIHASFIVLDFILGFIYVKCSSYSSSHQ